MFTGLSGKLTIRLSSIQLTPTNTHAGIMDPIYNKGPLFWYRLDESIRTELEGQYALMQDYARFLTCG